MVGDEARERLMVGIEEKEEEGEGESAGDI